MDPPEEPRRARTVVKLFATALPVALALVALVAAVVAVLVWLIVAYFERNGITFGP